MNNLGTDNFDFQLVSKFSGYTSSVDKTIAAADVLVQGSKNVYKKLSGTIAIRPGLKRLDSADATLAGVDSSFEWYTSLNRVYPLRVCNSKLQVYYSSTWYDLLTSLTLSRFVFDSWWDNTDKKDKLVFVQGNSNTYAWDGGITTVASGTLNTITKLDTSTTWAQDGFASSGTVTINGVDYTYSGGANTSILTGVGTDASALTSGLVGVSKVVTNSNSPASGFKGDFLKVIGNHLYVGSYTSRLIYISKSSSYTDFTQSTPRIPGDGELLTLDEAGKGISVRQGKAHISAGLSDWYIVSFKQDVIGTTLTETTLVDKQQTANLDAALGHEFIDVVGDTIVYLDQNNQLRAFGTFRNINQAKYPTLSLPIKDELIDEDFTGGHLRAIGDIIYITAPISGKDYMYETRESLSPQGNITAEKFWHPPQVRNVSRFAIISGVLYGHSNANPQIYQIWDTSQWHDDSPTDEAIPYDAHMVMAYRNSGKRFQLLSFDKVFYEGYMANGSPVNGIIRANYQGVSKLLDFVINSNQNGALFYSGANAPSLGDSSIGDNPLGDGVSQETNDQELLPKFRDIYSAGTSLAEMFEYQLEVYSNGVDQDGLVTDSRWEILALGGNIKLSEKNPVELMKPH